jgi:site-specific recombinase XerD
MNKTSEALDLFLKHKRPNTRRSYRQSLIGLELAARKPLEKITPMDIMRFLDGIAERLATATVKRHFHAIRSTYNYLVDLQLIPINPAKAAARAISWRQEEQRRPTATLDWGVMRKALRAQISSHPKKVIQARAVVALLFGAGLRRSEALGLNMDSVKVSEFGEMYLELSHTKSGKKQMRFLAKFARKFVARLVSQRKEEGADNSDPLLVFYYKDGRERGRLSEKTFYLIFRRVMKSIGVKAAPHSARAALATKLKREGVDDRIVAQVLGHATDQMVKVYDHRRISVEENPLKDINL